MNELHNLPKEELIKIIEVLSEKSKKYGLVWETHAEDVEITAKTSYPVLTELKDKAILTNGNLPVNLLFEGDNLHSLITLQYTHKGLVDVVYIDIILQRLIQINYPRSYCA